MECNVHVYFSFSHIVQNTGNRSFYFVHRLARTMTPGMFPIRIRESIYVCVCVWGGGGGVHEYREKTSKTLTYICKRISMRLHIMAVRKHEKRMPANLLHCMLGNITHSRVFPVCNPSPRAFPYRFLWERFCLRLLIVVPWAIVYDLFSDRSVFIPVQRLQYKASQ